MDSLGDLQRSKALSRRLRKSKPNSNPKRSPRSVHGKVLPPITMADPEPEPKLSHSDSMEVIHEPNGPADAFLSSPISDMSLDIPEKDEKGTSANMEEQEATINETYLSPITPSWRVPKEYKHAHGKEATNLEVVTTLAPLPSSGSRTRNMYSSLSKCSSLRSPSIRIESRFSRPDPSHEMLSYNESSNPVIQTYRRMVIRLVQCKIWLVRMFRRIHGWIQAIMSNEHVCTLGRLFRNLVLSGLYTSVSLAALVCRSLLAVLVFVKKRILMAVPPEFRYWLAGVQTSQQQHEQQQQRVTAE